MNVGIYINEIESLLSDLKDVLDTQVNVTLKEIDTLTDEIEAFKAQNEDLQDNAEILLNKIYLLECKCAHLELELVEEVIKNKTT